MHRISVLVVCILMGMPVIPLMASPADQPGRAPVPQNHSGSREYTDLSAMNTSGIAVGPDGPARLCSTCMATGEKAISPKSGTQSSPDIAAQSDGDYVVAWADLGMWTIFAKILDRDGNNRSGEITVSNLGSSLQQPAVGVRSDDSFTVTWRCSRGTSLPDIYAQMFTKDGIKLGSEIAVSVEAGTQADPAIAVGQNDNFIIAWTDAVAANNADIYCQRFDIGGNKLGGKIPVATQAANQTKPRVAVNSSNDFIVTWQDDTLGANVQAQRFSSDGNKLGAVIPVTQGSGTRINPKVAVRQNDDFMIAWSEHTGSYYDICARRFDVNGNPEGSKVQVTSGTGLKYNPGIASTLDGDFILVWDNVSGPGENRIDCCMLKKNESVLEEVDIANSSASMSRPNIGANPEGNFLVVWEDSRTGPANVFASPVVHSYSSEGFIETADLSPPGLWRWSNLSIRYDVEEAGNNSVAADYSTDQGTSWHPVASGGDLSGAARSPSLRARVKLGTENNRTTPVLYSFNISWITNVPPVVTLPPNLTAYRGSFVNITAEMSDADGDALVPGWNQTGGPPADFTVLGNGTLSFRPPGSGEYSFQLSVSDGFDLVNASVNVTVANRPPTVSLVPGRMAWKNDPVALSAAALDPDGDELTVTWTQTSGNFSYIGTWTGANLSFMAVKTGVFSFKAVANDGENDSEPAFVNLTVWSRPPTPVLGVNNGAPRVGVLVVFDASNSSDADGNVTSFNYHFGDGNETGWISNASASHAYSEPGTYNANVSLRDEDGNVSTSASIGITVTLALPQITITRPVDNETIPTRSVQVNFTVENFLVANGSKHIHFQLDTQPEVMWYSLAPYTFTGLSDGLHVIRAFLESEAHQRLTNPEASAVVIIIVRPSGLPDLAISSSDITVKPAGPKAGDTVTITATLYNTGEADAKAFSVRFLVDGKTVGDKTVTTLGKGANIVREVTWTAREGMHTIEVMADPGNGIDELNKTNNGASLTLSVAKNEGTQGFPWAMIGAVAVIIVVAAVCAVLLLRRRKPVTVIQSIPPPQ